jgi:hypothetical protein
MATKLRHDPAKRPRKRNKFMLKALRIITKHIRAMINELRSFRQLESLVRHNGDETLEEENERINALADKWNAAQFSNPKFPTEFLPHPEIWKLFAKVEDCPFPAELLLQFRDKSLTLDCSNRDTQEKPFDDGLSYPSARETHNSEIRPIQDKDFQCHL